MEYEDIIYSKEGHIATIRMNRPERLNGWSSQMQMEIVSAIDDAWEDEGSRVLIFTGTGRAFCAGGEATTLVQRYVDAGDAKRKARDAALGNIRGVLQALKPFDKPTIAAVNGIAAGAGFALTLMCDIRIASEKARFGNIYMRRGTVPSMAPYYLPKVVGLGKACRLIFADEIIDASESERIGLVSRVVVPEELDKAATEMASRIAKGPPVAMRLAKRAIYKSFDVDFDTLRQFNVLAGMLAMNITSEMKEGFEAFMGKRDPKF